LVFFDEYYQKQQWSWSTKTLDMSWHLVIPLGSAAETYEGAYNSVTIISGLITVAQELLQLPKIYVQKINRTYIKNFLTRIPPLPLRQFMNRTTLAPAVAYDRIQNTEIPQLYPVHPYGIYGLGKPNLSIAVDTYLYDTEIQSISVSCRMEAGKIFCARLGSTEQAKKYTALKVETLTGAFQHFGALDLIGHQIIIGVDWV